MEEEIVNLIQWSDEEKEVFSEEQMGICQMKASGSFTSSIMEKYNLSSLSNIR